MLLLLCMRVFLGKTGMWFSRLKNIYPHQWIQESSHPWGLSWSERIGKTNHSFLWSWSIQYLPDAQSFGCWDLTRDSHSHFYPKSQDFRVRQALQVSSLHRADGSAHVIINPSDWSPHFPLLFLLWRCLRHKYTGHQVVKYPKMRVKKITPSWPGALHTNRNLSLSDKYSEKDVLFIYFLSLEVSDHSISSLTPKEVCIVTAMLQTKYTQLHIDQWLFSFIFSSWF